jgi:transcriptional regulator
MYNPTAFRHDDPDRLAAFVDSAVFGTLVSNGADGPRASHLPFLLERAATGSGTLRAHLARANDHWTLLDGAPVLVIFHGPEHYVTPSWYASKAKTGKVVPTWNYVVVHARGRARIWSDADRLRNLVAALTDHMESARAAPWHVDDAPDDYVTALLEHVVGIDIELESLEGKFKLGQNRAAEDRASLAAGLASEMPAVAAAVAEFLPAAQTQESV